MVSLEKASDLYGIVAFVFSVLWFLGLLLNIMMLGLLAVGLGLFGYRGYTRFSHQGPTQKSKGTKAEQYLQNILGEKGEVKVIKNDTMDSALQELHEVLEVNKPNGNP